MKIPRKQKSTITRVFNINPKTIKCLSCDKIISYEIENGWEGYGCSCGFMFDLQTGLSKRIVVNHIAYDLLWIIPQETRFTARTRYIVLKYEKSYMLLLEYCNDGLVAERDWNAFVPFDISQDRFEKLLLLL